MTAAEALSRSAADLLRDLVARGWTLPEIAARTGLDRTSLHRIASGDRTANETYYRKIAAFSLVARR